MYVYAKRFTCRRVRAVSSGRGHFHYTSGSPLTELEINPLRTDDQSLYKCELTYLEVRDECAVIQFVNLTTLGELTWRITLGLSKILVSNFYHGRNLNMNSRNSRIQRSDTTPPLTLFTSFMC